MKKISNATMNPLVLGTVSGMRVGAGLLFTGLLVRQMPDSYFSPSGLVQFFRNKKVVKALLAAAVAEVVVDKLPSTPARISPSQLSARVITGAVCGATINSVTGKKTIDGAIAGSLMALASAFLFYYLRKSLGKTTGISDPYIGAAEDALAAVGGMALLQRN